MLEVLGKIFNRKNKLDNRIKWLGAVLGLIIFDIYYLKIELIQFLSFIFLAIWIILHLGAWYLMVNVTIKHYNGIFTKEERLRNTYTNNDIIRGDLKLTIGTIVLATLMIWLSVTGKCYHAEKELDTIVRDLNIP